MNYIYYLNCYYLNSRQLLKYIFFSKNLLNMHTYSRAILGRNTIVWRILKSYGRTFYTRWRIASNITLTKNFEWKNLNKLYFNIVSYPISQELSQN